MDQEFSTLKTFRWWGWGKYDLKLSGIKVFHCETNCEILFSEVIQWKLNELTINITLRSGDGGEKQGIRYGNPFQRHIPGVQQGQWW